MKLKFLLLLYLMSLTYTVHATNFIDPELITDRPVETPNRSGMQFNNLGRFEDSFIKECVNGELNNEKILNILILADGLGRQTLKVASELSTVKLSTAHIIANDISEVNFNSLKYKLSEMKNSSLSDKKCASQITTIVGDCLSLTDNREFKKLFHENNCFNKIDLLMCSNFLNSIDNEQVLGFFIKIFNMLIPGGKAYIFDRTNIEVYRQITAENIEKSNNKKHVYNKITSDILYAANKNCNTLFTGFIVMHGCTKNFLILAI